MAHGLVLRMQDYVQKIDTKKEITSTEKESAYVPVDEPDASSVEVVQIIKSWLLVTKNSRNSKMEFFSLLRETLLFMLSSKWTNCTKQNDLLHVFQNYHQKFSTIIKNAEVIKNSVVQLSNDPWRNPYFEWTELSSGKLTVADKNVQDYFAQEPEEIVLARVQSFVLHNNQQPAFVLAKLSFLYHSRVKNSIAKPCDVIPKESIKSSSEDEISCVGLASIDWYMTLLEKKKSLSLIIKEVSHLNCHEGVEIINRLKNNPRHKNLTFTLVQIFIMRDLIQTSKYCCTKKLFDLFCLVHKERNSSVKEITESVEKIFAAHAPSSSHLYLLVDVMWEKFGTRFYSLYVEFCIRGLTADINHLENAKTDENVLCDRTELETHISSTFAKLSTLFSYYTEASRDCMFSAFILKPTKSRFNSLRCINETINAKQKEASENSSPEIPFRDCTCTRYCNGYCKTSFCDSTFDHPLLKKGIRNVPYTLVEDLVCVLEGIRCLKFQYNIFTWKYAEPRLATYLKSYVAKNRQSVNSASNNQTNEVPKSEDCNSPASVPAVDPIKNKVLSPNALVKRKNSSDSTKSTFLDVGANIEVHSDDSSSKRMKTSTPPVKQLPEATIGAISRFKMCDAIEKVIRSSLNEKLTSEQAHRSTISSLFNEPKSNPVNLSEKGTSLYANSQSAYKNTSAAVGSASMTENKFHATKPDSQLVCRPNEESQLLNQSIKRPSVVMKSEHLPDKRDDPPYETQKQSLLKSSLLRRDSYPKPIRDTGFKSDLSYKNDQLRSQERDRNQGALNLSSSRRLDVQPSKSSFQTSHHYPLDLKCERRVSEAPKTNRALVDPVFNQNVRNSNQITNRLTNTPTAETKAIDRNSVIQHTMQHLDIKIPKNLSVSIVSDKSQQKESSNLPAFNVKVPNKNLPKSNFVSANLVIPRSHSSSSTSAVVDPHNSSSHDEQEMINIPGILAPKSVIKRSWEVPPVHNKIELKKVVQSSTITKQTYSHPYQKQPAAVKTEWPQEFISKTEKVTKSETTYQIYRTKQIPDNGHVGKWKTAGDNANTVQARISSSSNSQTVPMKSVQSSVQASNSQMLPINLNQSRVPSSNSQMLSMNAAQSGIPLSNSQMFSRSSVQPSVSSSRRVPSSNTQMLSMNVAQSGIPSSNSQVLSRNLVQSEVSSSNSQTSSNSFQSTISSSSQPMPFSYQNTINSRSGSPYSNNMTVPRPQHTNAQMSVSDNQKSSLCSYSYKQTAGSSPNLMQSNHHLKDNISMSSGQESKLSFPVASSQSLLKTSLTSQLVKRHNSQTNQLYTNYLNSKMLQGSNATNAFATATTSMGSVDSSQRFQSSLPQPHSPYRSSPVLNEDNKDIVFKTAQSRASHGHNSSMCCSPSEVNPCQNCSLSPGNINFNCSSTNVQTLPSPSANLNSPGQINYDVDNIKKEEELFLNDQLFQCPPPQEEYTSCHICSMTCSFTNYQLHLEKYHSFDAIKKGNFSTDMAKDFDLYDLQSTSYNNSLNQNYSKDLSNDLYNVYDAENKTASVDLPQNESNLNLCMNLMNDPFDRMSNYIENVDSPVAYSNDSSFKLSEILQNSQNNTTGLENSNNATETLNGMNLDHSFIEGNSMYDSGSNLDEMLDFLGNSTNLTETSQPSQSHDINVPAMVNTQENFMQNRADPHQLVSNKKFKKKFYCKLCLNKKVRCFSTRNSMVKHVKTFHLDSHVSNCMGFLVNGQLPSTENVPQHVLAAMQNKPTVSNQIIESTVPVKSNETKAINFNYNLQFDNNLIRYNSPICNSSNDVKPTTPGEFQLNSKASPEKKTKYPQVKCRYCGKMLTNIYMKQHIARVHPDALASNHYSDDINLLPRESMQSVPVQSNLDQEVNTDSNTCLSVSDAWKGNDKSNHFLNVPQRPNEIVGPSLVPSPKFIPEERLEQNLNLDNFPSDSTHIFYTCHLCQRRYTSQSFLSKHIKTYHINDLNAAAKSDNSFNEMSDSSKFSDTVTPEANQPLEDMPYRNNSDNFGNYNSVENNLLNASVYQGDNFDANSSGRNLEELNSSLQNSNPLSCYQPGISGVENVLHSDSKKYVFPNLNTASEMDYSNTLLTDDDKRNLSHNISLEQEQYNSAMDNNLDTSDTKVLSEESVINQKLPRFKCAICLHVYSGKAYFKKHYKFKHNRSISDKEVEALETFSDPVKRGDKKKKKKLVEKKEKGVVEHVNSYSRRLSLEASKSNFSGVNDLLSAEARSNDRVTCKICNKEYSNRGNLRIHMKNVHNYRGRSQRIVEGNKKEVQCHICLKLLINASLKTHVQSVHGNAFLTDEQEAFTVANVAALSAVNYCAESIQRPLPYSSSSEVLGLNSNDLNQLATAVKVSENINQLRSETNASNVKNFKNLSDSGTANFSTIQHSNHLYEKVADVSGHQALNESPNLTEAISNVKLENELSNQNIPFDLSDFDEEFSLSDIPTSDDECANFMDTVMQQAGFMEDDTTSELAKDNSSFTEGDQDFVSLEQNGSLKPVLDKTENDKNKNYECIMDNKSGESQNSLSPTVSSVENVLNSFPGTGNSSDLAQSKACENLEATVTSAPETLKEFHNSDLSSIQKLKSATDLEHKAVNSLNPVKDCKPNENFITNATDGNETEDDFNTSSDALSNIGSPMKINSDDFSTDLQESRTSECRFCHKMFANMKLLSKHLKISHNIPFLKKQKSAKRKPDQHLLSPPLLTQHQNYESNNSPSPMETCMEKSVFVDEKASADEIFKSNNNKASLENNSNQDEQNDNRTHLFDSTDPEQSCKLIKYSPRSTPDATNIEKDLTADYKFESRKRVKLSNPDDIAVLNDASYEELESGNNFLDNGNSNKENNKATSLTVCDNDFVDSISENHENEHQMHPVSSNQENDDKEDKISKAPILPCIIKVLKDEQNTIIYQIDKSKGDEPSPNSPISEPKSSPSLNRHITNCKNPRNSKHYRKKLNRSPYQARLYSRRRSLMGCKPRPLFERKNTILKRGKALKRKRTKPIIQTFKYPSDVISFLKQNKQPIVQLTRLSEETFLKYNCYTSSIFQRVNEKPVIIRLEECDVQNIKRPMPSISPEVIDISSSNDALSPEQTAFDNGDISTHSVMKFPRNSPLPETTANVAVVLHKINIDFNSSVVPLTDNFELPAYKNFQKLPAIKECRVVLNRLEHYEF